MWRPPVALLFTGGRGWARGRVRVGPRSGAGRLAGVAVPSRRRAAPTALPWCIAVSGEGGPAAPLRGRSPPPSQGLGVCREGPRGRVAKPHDRLRQPGRWVLYEWSGAGLEPASGDSWEEAGFLRAGVRGRAESSVPLWRRKVDLARGPAAGEAPVSSSELLGLWPLLETSRGCPAPAALLIGPSRFHLLPVNLLKPGD